MTGFWEFNYYAGEAREIFSNDTRVLIVAGWLVGCLFFCVDLIDGAQQRSVLQVISCEILMAYTGTLAARGSGVGSFRSFCVTWASVSSY